MAKVFIQRVQATPARREWWLLGNDGTMMVGKKSKADLLAKYADDTGNTSPKVEEQEGIQKAADAALTQNRKRQAYGLR